MGAAKDGVMTSVARGRVCVVVLRANRDFCRPGTERGCGL